MNGNHGKDFGYIKMGGRIDLVPSSENKVSINLPVGSVPTITEDGDMWRTSEGVFMNFNGTIKKLTFTDV
jgi:hypothetical protein